jgi:thioredoxin-related protein
MADVNGQRWILDHDEALKAARRLRKPILLQFHRENCSGCRKLDAVTYLDEQVSAEMYGWFVPLVQDIIENRQVRSQYSAYWTPSFFVLNERGHILTSFNGYLGPEDFRVFLRLAFAAYLIPKGKYRETVALMEEGVEKFPDNPRASTMLFTKGMAGYLTGRDKVSFYEVMSEIRSKYPHSLEARTWPYMEE